MKLDENDDVMTRIELMKVLFLKLQDLSENGLDEKWNNIYNSMSYYALCQKLQNCIEIAKRERVNYHVC